MVEHSSPENEPIKGFTGTRWRHIKRGTTYEVVSVAKLQTALTGGLADEAPMVVYRNEATGKLSVRSLDEFCDGRFERMPASPVTDTALKPCPFCGTEPQIIREADFVSVACPHYYCNFSQIALHNEKKAIDRWNTRSAHAQRRLDRDAVAALVNDRTMINDEGFVQNSEAVADAILALTSTNGLPPINEGLHTDKLIAELQKPAMQLDQSAHTSTDSEMVECNRCGGSGFEGRGTGYGDVCSECGGQRVGRRRP